MEAYQQAAAQRVELPIMQKEFILKWKGLAATFFGVSAGKVRMQNFRCTENIIR